MNQQEKQEKTQQIVDGLSKLVNTISSSSEKETAQMLYEAIRRDHPTLQQAMFRTLFRIIEAMAEDNERRTDARNEDAKKICQAVLEAFRDKMDFTGAKPSDYLGYV